MNNKDIEVFINGDDCIYPYPHNEELFNDLNTVKILGFTQELLGEKLYPWQEEFLKVLEKHKDKKVIMVSTPRYRDSNIHLRGLYEEDKEMRNLFIDLAAGLTRHTDISNMSTYIVNYDASKPNKMSQKKRRIKAKQSLSNSGRTKGRIR